MSEPTSRAPKKSPRWLLPKEHGAYAQLVMPLLVALLIGTPTVAAYALAIAICAAFVGQESVRVIIGFRGKRKQEKLFALALRWGIGSALVAAAFTALALVTSTRETWLALAIPGAFAAVSFALVFAKLERNTIGESIAAMTLAACAVPVAIAGQVAWPAALMVMASFSTAFIIATIAVRAVIVNHKHALPLSARVGRVLAAIVLPVGLVVAGTHWWADAWAMGLAMAPVCAFAAWLMVRMPHPKRLREMGWMLAAASTAMTVGLTIALLATSGFVTGS